jgi:hypothetical protein
MNENEVRKCEFKTEDSSYNIGDKCRLAEIYGLCFKGYCNANSNCYYKQLQQLKAENKKLKKGMELFKKYSCDECISATYDEETGEQDFCESCCKGNINNLANQILIEIGGLNEAKEH